MKDGSIGVEGPRAMDRGPDPSIWTLLMNGPPLLVLLGSSFAKMPSSAVLAWYWW
ncbi:hypothetical protein VP1G_10937 [Cytospora mali]|uniref:Uncharacterized protein n=1 Tax=Cytospora mali TaxID=578113 RepID=A0A194V0Z7_CYTMA|nr:hypothetical protein VP1G_10937 [Valsa mali var. pyri (nom. inval.)]